MTVELLPSQGIQCPRCHQICEKSPCSHCGAHFTMRARKTPPAKADPQCIASSYHLGKRLGSGGMAHVYQALRRKDQQAVIIKMPRQADEANQQRFITEARALGTLQHRNCPKLLDLDATNTGIPFLVLSHVPGTTLRHVLEHGTLNLPAFEHVAESVARALNHCHGRGVIHRDIKPENIIVGHKKITLIDFGLARLDALNEVIDKKRGQLTPAGALLGTPPYTAPEQLRSPHEVDGSADMYAFGMVLRECLGAASSYPAQYSQRVDAWHQLISRCCALDPEKRPSAEQLIDQLPFLPTIPQTGHYPAATAVPSSTHKPSLAWPLLIAAAFLFSLGISAVGFYHALNQPVWETLEGPLSAREPAALSVLIPPGTYKDIEPLPGTKIRLPGGGPWTDQGLTLYGNSTGTTVIQLLSDNDHWHLRVEK